MTNLFSPFDPCTGMFSLNWMSMIIMMIIMPYNFWIIPNKNMIMMMKMLKKINMELNSNLTYKSSTIMMMSLMMMIMMNNMMGLVPYVFTCSSHLMFSLSLSLPMWMSFMMYATIKKTNKMFCHLLPKGTPKILMPFMIMIETISNLIRPMSLAVRLSANMIAGHMILALMGNSNKNMMLIIMLMLMILLTFELAVSIIQSYVFMTLTSLYSSEM
uniref:ATP synthase F0 subunit 6 n=1 Tax=Krisna quadrimaculosus TaxID=3041591 RepID=UPI002551D91C|nr:ATP synthase F0 subunit 6 [Krisna quadrimaculosus]WGG89450.1 ATP synthase F0 subunit 6 [Krisna quadrimaculosus]